MKELKLARDAIFLLKAKCPSCECSFHVNRPHHGDDKEKTK